jgi:hypothetical protein
MARNVSPRARATPEQGVGTDRVLAFIKELGHLDHCLNAVNGQCLSKMDSAA